MVTSNPVHYVPKGYLSIAPYLAVENASEAIEFYEKAFNATERMRMSTPEGKVGHAEIMIGDAVIMISDPWESESCSSGSEPPSQPVKKGEQQRPSIVMHLYVPDVDAFVSRAEGAGAKVISPPETMFWGARSAKISDPFGHVWSVATQVEEPSMEEIQRRAKEMKLDIR